MARCDDILMISYSYEVVEFVIFTIFQISLEMHDFNSFQGKVDKKKMEIETLIKNIFF